MSLVQDIFRQSHSSILVTIHQKANLTRAILKKFLETADDGVVGLAPGYGPNCVLSVLAVATSTTVLLVQFTKLNGKKRKKGKNGATQANELDLLEELIFCADSCSKFAFQMDILATSLYFDYGLRIRGAVDLLATGTGKDERHSLAAMMNALGGEGTLNKLRVGTVFSDEKFGKTSRLEDVSLRAWCAWRAATLTNAAQRLNAAPRISTQDLDETRLSVLAKMVRDTCRLEALKPTRVKNDIEREYKCKKDQLHVKSTRFKTRIADRNQRVEIQTMKNGQRVTLPGTITRVDGRAAQITHKAKLQDGPIKVTTVGKEAPTNAEAERADIILSVLQGKYSLEIPFFQAIWLPRENPAWRAVPSTSRSVLPIRFQRPLNDSQKRAVAAILSPQRISVIHGPPGTGKTTVIAAAVTSMDAIKDRRGKSMWLVAQSNVAVKNIAEKLASVGFFDFKLLVSKDFHYDWHEHIYEKIEPNVIRSDNLAKDTVAIGRQLMGTRVILCTLSMLSNDRIAPITRMVPLQIVIIDEASQVEIGSFLPLVHRFSRVLEKLVFIGDDKQLAPYGQGDIDSLKSVFEMEHLREGALFLDTQYRMPIQLGNFIGKHVYHDKLKTVHSDSFPCCRFLDVHKGKETRSGSSWINMNEIAAAITQARKYDAEKKSYRIITPYDAQRAKLEAALKASKLPWEDKVFCVDSFQGNEDDYIILSVVRTEKIGFLAEPRRVNVMLSRCKKGMTICTNRAFVEGKAKDSLVGLLATSLGVNAWHD